MKKDRACACRGTSFRMAYLTFLVIAFSAATVSAQTNAIWNGGSGEWSAAPNWSGGVVPDGSYNVRIDNGNPVVSQVNLDINATANNVTIDSDDSLRILNGNTLSLQGGRDQQLRHDHPVQKRKTAAAISRKRVASPGGDRYIVCARQGRCSSRVQGRVVILCPGTWRIETDIQ